MFDFKEIELPDQMRSAAGEDEVAYQLTCEALADTDTSHRRAFLPDSTEGLDPVLLAAFSCRADRSEMNGHELVELMAAESKLVSILEGAKLVSMAEMAHSPPSDEQSEPEREPIPDEFAALEVAAALRLTRRAAETELGLALSLRGPLLRVGEALRAGALDSRKARLFFRHLDHLSPTTREAVLDRVLDVAGDLTTGQLRARVARIALELDPTGEEQGYQAGRDDRKMTAGANPDNTGFIALHGADPTEVASAQRFINMMARHLKTKDETRTLDQIRHDVAIDLLRGKWISPRQQQPSGVQLIVTVETLAGMSEAPGDIEGFGPVMAEIARKAAAENVDGDWTFVAVDNGKAVATGTLARRPTAAMMRYLRASYPTCRFMGCRMPAAECDIDHIHPYSKGGRTAIGHLVPLGRHHHRGKHATKWHPQLKQDGSVVWISPHGHTYVRPRDPPL